MNPALFREQELDRDHLVCLMVHVQRSMMLKKRNQEEFRHLGTGEFDRQHISR